MDTPLPKLRFLATHFGGWQDWKEVAARLIGRPISMEISLSLDALSVDEVRAMALAHPADRLLFGSDSPWDDQAAALDRLGRLGLGESLMRKMLWENAAKFFRLG